jgi:hypothetical protein
MKNLMYIIGVVFVLLGVVGFFQDPILGFLDVDTMLNLVYLVTGILAIVFTMQGDQQGRKFFMIFGIIFALITILGFITGEGNEILGLLTVTSANNYFHLVVTVVFLILGLKKPAGSSTMSSPM